MLFNEEFNQKEELEVKPQATVSFEDDDVAMGCIQNCWSGCIGTCRYNSH